MVPRRPSTRRREAPADLQPGQDAEAVGPWPQRGVHEDDDVLHASVQFSDTESTEAEAIPIGDQFTALSELLQNLENHPLVAERNLTIDYSDLRQLGWRLSELIPLGINKRQELLEMNDPLERLSKIEKLVSDMANNS